MDKSDENQVNRRDFMKVAIVTIGGVIAAALGLPALPYLAGPALKKDVEEWIRLGSVSKIELNNPTLFKTAVERQTGWINAEEEISAYILTSDGKQFIAISNICTHLGCKVRWIADKEGFFCPCHDGVFAKDGTVVSGPPPRPLDRFESKIEDGILYIKRG